MPFHRLRYVLLSVASCTFLGQPLLVQTISPVQAQTAQTYPVVRPGAWTGSHAWFPTAEEACQHLADNDRGGRRVLSIDLSPPSEIWLYQPDGSVLRLFSHSGASCMLENWGWESTNVYCPYEHPPYDGYIYIGGTKGVCVLSSVFQKPELTPYVRDAAAKGAPIDLTPEFWRAVESATGETPVRQEPPVQNPPENQDTPPVTPPIDPPIDLPPPSPELQEAREIARRLQQDPGWKDSLPYCPCTEDEIKKLPNEFEQAYIGLETYHPGAESGYRSAKPTTYNSEKIGERLQPGQQCTYAGGRLITGGAGAGTPDAFSPNSGVLGALSHRVWDVKTADVIPWQEYHKTWTPNNGNSCPVKTVP